LIGKDETAQQVRDDIETRPSVVPKSDEQLKNKTLHTKKSYDDDGNLVRGGKVRKPRRSDVSPLKGQATSKQTYESWLGSQSKLYQEEILGKSAAADFRSGTSLGKVLSDRNSAINFKSLEQALGE